MSMRNRTAIVEQATEGVDDYAEDYNYTIDEIVHIDWMIGRIESERRVTNQPFLHEDLWTEYMNDRKLLLEDLDDYTDRLQRIQTLVEQLRVEERRKYPRRF